MIRREKKREKREKREREGEEREGEGERRRENELAKKKRGKTGNNLDFFLSVFWLLLHRPGFGDKHQALGAREAEGEAEDHRAADQGKGRDQDERKGGIFDGERGEVHS